MLLVINPNKAIKPIDENPFFCSAKKSKGAKGEKFMLDGDKFNENRIFLWTYAQTKSVKEIEALMKQNKYTNPLQGYSVNNSEGLFETAIKENNIELFKLCLKEFKNTNRPPLPEIPLSNQGTGTFNRHMFGFFTKPVSLGRGGKEGNNAFTSDENLRSNHEDSLYIKDISELDPTPEMIKLLVLNNFIDEGDVLNALF